MPPAKIRTEINPLASSLSSSALKTSRSPPPSLTLLDATPLRRYYGRCKHSNRQCSYRRRRGGRSRKYLNHTKYSAVEYQYHPLTPDTRDEMHRCPEDEDGRTFVDWLFLRPFRCKHPLRNQATSKSTDIAAIFSMTGMPSAAELLCGSIDSALELEQVLASVVGIMNDNNQVTAADLDTKKQLSEVSFKIGCGPIIRYTNGEEWILPTSSGLVPEEAFNTVKKICGFEEDSGKISGLHVFTKQEVACPIGETFHHVEFRANHVKEELAFRLGRRQADNECQTIIRDACHRFLATSIDDSFLFLISGPPTSGKSSVLREFRKALSSSNGFHQWNMVDGNQITNYVSAESTHNLSSCMDSYVKEVISNNLGKQRKRSPYVMMFDDLSLEQGLPMAQDVAKFGINVIATIGNGHTAEYNTCNLANTRTDSVKLMVLEISSDEDIRSKAPSRKRKSIDIKAKYKLITVGNSANRKRANDTV